MTNNVVPIEVLKAKAEAAAKEAKALEKGDGGGDSGGMDLVARVDRIETRLDKMDERLRSVEIGVGEIKGKIDGLAGQVGQLERLVVSKLPSWWQIPAIIGATITLVAILGGGLLWAGKHLV